VFVIQNGGISPAPNGHAHLKILYKKSSNLHKSFIFGRSVAIFIPACSGGKVASYGAIVVCVGARILLSRNQGLGPIL
jgi:hypothetical protein